MADNAAKILVQVKLFGHLRQFLPQTVVDLQVDPGTSVYELILQMLRQHDEQLRQAILDASENLHGGIEVVLNQEHLPARKLDSIKLNENCQIYILPMIEGGRQ
jgi:molybdopterin converting factor small subunit